MRALVLACLLGLPTFCPCPVNDVRHQLTRYEDNLATLYGRVGTADGYALLSQKVFAAIAQTYPTLAGECRRQLNARRD